MKYSIKSITLIGILASMNGIIEIGLGTLLHLIHIPQAGSIMVAINMTIYFIARRLIPRVGIVMTMGFITALLKFFYGGGGKIQSSVAIFLEALLLEIILYIFPLNKLVAIVSGSILHTFTLLYSVISLVVFGGNQALLNLKQFLYKGIFPFGGVLVMFVFLFLLFVITGCLWGLAAWHISTFGVYYYQECVSGRKIVPLLKSGPAENAK